MSHRRSLKVHVAAACVLALLSFTRADIICSQPNSGSFKAGDPITLAWTSTGSPKLSDVSSMSGALVCDNNTKVADITITSWAGPMTWTVPSVGNATTPGGTVGACPSNSFHVEYSGKYKVFLFEQSWGPVKCTPITILPDPGIVPTTTTIAPTSTTRSSSTTSATASPTTTDTGDSQQGSGPSTSVVAIVSVVAALVLFLVLFGTWWHLRKKRRQRMEDAIMPWTNQPGNQFTKVPSTDGDRNEVAGSGSNYKPAAPEPSHAAPNYQDNGYGYGQHGQHGAGGYGYNNGYGNGYDNGQDDYYNPHYAGQNVQGYPPHPGNGPSPSYYNEYSGRSSPQLDPYQKNPQTGYFPPPALSSKSSKSSPSAPRENLVYNSQSSASLTTSPSSRRAPQVIVPDKSTSQDDGGQHIPMKDMSSR